LEEKERAAEEKEREAINVKNREIKAEEGHQHEIEWIQWEAFFDDLLARMQGKGYTFADLLDYVFNPTTKFGFDWWWRGFFADKVTVQRIFDYWTTSKYNKTSRTLVHEWAMGKARKAAGQESR
jgi:hypothetical protein